MSNKALIVDNDFFFVEFLSDLVEQRGFEVSKAYDGKEGITKLEEGVFDLFFIDLIMPKIDGRQFIEFIRRKFPDNHFPIVAVSGIIVEQLDSLNEIGADYFMAKGPFEKMKEQFDKLMDKIKKQPLPDPSEKDVFEPENIYPRHDTVELIETLNFQRAIAECIGVGIIVVDRDARIIITNSLALDILDRSLEKILNQPIVNIFPDEEKPRLVKALKRILKNPEIRKINLSVAINSREVGTVISLLKVNGKITGYLFALEDTEI